MASANRETAMRTTAVLLTLALVACGKSPSPAPEQKALSCVASEGGTVTASNAWVREQRDANGMTAAYFTVCNGAMAPATLTGVETAIAGYAEFHETTKDERGVVSMAPAGELTLAPGERLVFEPGGKHVMLMELKRAVAAGEEAPLMLQFADGSALAVEAVARSAAEAADDPEH